MPRAWRDPRKGLRAGLHLNAGGIDVGDDAGRCWQSRRFKVLSQIARGASAKWES